MLDINKEYDLYIDGEFVEVANIIGAVNGIAYVIYRGNPYQFYTNSGKPINAPAMELREPEETDVGALKVYVTNLAANIDNKKLSDKKFRDYARTMVELMQESIAEGK